MGFGIDSESSARFFVRGQFSCKTPKPFIWQQSQESDIHPTEWLAFVLDIFCFLFGSIIYTSTLCSELWEDDLYGPDQWTPLFSDCQLDLA